MKDNASNSDVSEYVDCADIDASWLLAIRILKGIETTFFVLILALILFIVYRYLIPQRLTKVHIVMFYVIALAQTVLILLTSVVYGLKPCLFIE